jgi:large repetitive protein
MDYKVMLRLGILILCTLLVECAGGFSAAPAGDKGLGNNPLAVTSFSPASGTVGTTVTIEGTGFFHARSVAFDGITASSFSVVSDTLINAVVPSLASTGPLSVRTVHTTASSTSLFTVLQKPSMPSINSFSPTKGAAGTSVTINGVGFSTASSVKFNGTSAAFKANSDSQIAASVPSGATSGPISVTDPTGTSASPMAFTVTQAIAAPQIASFSPTSGAAGASVTINGSGFTGATIVAFNGTNATFTVSSDSQIAASVPSGATTGPISVTNPSGTAVSATAFTVTQATAAPQISSFSPTSGAAGASVTINGSGFTTASSVKFNGTSAAFKANSDSQIVATVASGTTTGPISVTNPSGTAVSATAFTVTQATAAPQISSFSPTSGATGASVTINGSGFTGATNVTFNGTKATFTVSSDSQISTSVPTGASTGPIAVTTPQGTATSSANFTVSTSGTTVHHYEYVFPDGYIYVYDMDNNFALVKKISVPTTAGVRGTVASVKTGMLYISYGGDGGGNGNNGNLLAYNLQTDTVAWTHSYSFGIDSQSVSNDGTKIYLPDGELTSNGTWYVIDSSNGNVLGTINSGGTGPHNTVINPADSHVYLGPRYTNYLVEASTATDQVIKQIGPITAGTSGIRPFTINGSETLAFVTKTGYLGFVVADINTGQVLYNVPVQGFSASGAAASAPSHGITLSPDEKEVYLIDSANSYVHVFDVSGLPGTAPKQVADIKLVNPLSGNESGCAYDCLKDGWLHHSRGGQYVFVGDSGDVINTSTRTTVATLPAMANSRKEIEIDFQNNAVVWAMNNRSSLGTVTSGSPSASTSSGLTAPQISSFTPTSGGVGTAVVISGSGFTGATNVAFNGTHATFTVASDSQVNTSVPTGATTGPISVTTSVGTATSSATFTVPSSTPATVGGGTTPPQISSFTPTSGGVGTSVVISGSGFTGATNVAFNGTHATFTVASDSQVNTSVPTGATTGPISVTTSVGTATSPATFTISNSTALKNSGPLTISGQSGQVISNLHITSTTGDCVQITNSTNITIQNSEIGPCGKGGVRISGGSGINLYDNYIHPDAPLNPCCDQADSVYATGTQQLTIWGNVIAYGESNIEVSGSTGVTVRGNFLLNPRNTTTGSRGQNFQSWNSSSNITVENNYALSSEDTTLYSFAAKQEDSINFGYTNGIMASGNYITGGQSSSGCGLIADSNANSATFTSNILVNTGQCGIGISSGTNQVVDSNQIINRTPVSGGGNTAIYVANYSKYACGPVSLSNNIAAEVRSDGSISSLFLGSGCGTVSQSNNTWGQAAVTALTPAPPPPAAIPPEPFACPAPSPYTTQHGCGR